MSQHPSPAVQLNNYLQGKHELDAISWLSKDTGPQNHKTWTVTCKYNGKVIGTGVAAQKIPAKDEAARQALQYFQNH